LVIKSFVQLLESELNIYRPTEKLGSLIYMSMSKFKLNKTAITKMMTILIVAVIAVALIAGVAGAYYLSTTGNSSVVKLTLVTEWTADPQLGAVNSLIAKFNAANPGIQVVHQPMDMSSFNNLLAVWLGTDSAPDLHQWFGGARTQEIVNLGDCLSWTDQYNQVKSQFSEGVRNSLMEYNGNAYAVPLNINTYGIFYNKHIFTQYNITPPQTWAELLSACESIKTQSNGAVAPMVCADKLPWNPDLQFTAILSQCVSPEFYQGLLDGSKSWQDPQVLYAFQRYAELVPYMASNIQELDEMGAAKALVDGKVAMDIVGPYRDGMLKTAGFEPGVDFDWIRMPTILSEFSGTMPSHSDVIVASSTTPYPEQCRKFLAYVATTEAQEIFASAGGFIAGNSNVDKSAYDSVMLKISNYIQTTTATVAEVSLSVRQEITTPWFNAMAQFMANPQGYAATAATLDTILWKAPT
jgi:ABC-type glycerol-3-phosphate transport system substrate-binding protein